VENHHPPAAALARKREPEQRKYFELKGVKELRKIRAGNFRVIYSFRKTELLLLVIKIGQRQDVYKDLNKKF
jgi:mRNA-degrading endonuclease RelE of RelBE toxin-antitoxin system